MKVVFVVGTRPEAIKMAPVILEAKSRGSDVTPVLCSTGQHREMLEQVYSVFDIRPDFDLDIMVPDQSLGHIAARAFLGLEELFARERPDWVLVQGDTTTAAIGAMVAYYCKVKVAHVEAGLRTGDKWHPFPEEINRRIAGVVADMHFAPTEGARENLSREGVPGEHILITGNTVVDALQRVAVAIDSNPDIVAKHVRDLLATLSGRRLVLVTCHRRENIGEPLRRVCSAIRTLARTVGDDVWFVLPVHPNPRVEETVRTQLGNEPNVTLLPPVDYVDLVRLMAASYLILTDSGGIQEEAPALGVPVLVLRSTTERPEGVFAGTAALVGTDESRIIDATQKLLHDPSAYATMARATNPYGDGLAGKRIVDYLLGKPVDPFVAIDSAPGPAQPQRSPDQGISA